MTRVGSLFSGTGALDLAVHEVLAATPTWFVENDTAASKVLAHHWPEIPNYGDITKVDWATVEPVDILTGGFPCLPAGALVDAGEDGLRPIETLRVGDRVLTHMRRQRRIASVMRRQAEDVLTIKAMGAPSFRVTREHPFYVRRISYIYQNRQRIRVWSEPEWVQAGYLDNFCWLAMPLDKATLDPVLGAALAYVVGRWLGDGWIVDHFRTSKTPVGQRGSRVTSRVHKAIVCAAYDEAGELATAISAAGLHATRSAERTVVKFHISSLELVKILRPFGRGAAGKRLPGWVFTAPQAERAALLRGWLDADGSQQASGAWRCATISEELAHGMSRLARNVHGVATSVHRIKRTPQAVIEGRIVNQCDGFEVVIPPRNRESFVADGYAWVPIRSVTEADPCEVFNLSVEDDESYTAWGYAVHNCQDISAAGKRAGLRPSTRSGLWSHMAYAISQLQPKLVIIENVRGLLSTNAHCDLEPCPWCLGDYESSPLRALGAVLGDLANLGYVGRWHGLRAADVGAPHGRFRVFITAWSPSHPRGLRWKSGTGQGTGRDTTLWGTEGKVPDHGDGAAATNTDRLGPVRCWPARGRRLGSTDHGELVADPAGQGRGQPDDVSDHSGSAAQPAGQTEPRRCDSAAADPESVGRGKGWPESTGQFGGSDAAQRGDATPPDPHSIGLERDERWSGPPGMRRRPPYKDCSAHSQRSWVTADGTDYGPAIRRWEIILGRPAPDPTITGQRGGQQLSPYFTEWVQGWPEGWVIAVPGLTRNDQIRIAGNGVVPQQAALALRHLLAVQEHVA